MGVPRVISIMIEIMERETVAFETHDDELDDFWSRNPSRTGLCLALMGSAARWLGRAIASTSDWIFGAIALILGLSILAAVPIAQFLSLGYLLEAGGRVALTGKLRNGFVGIRKASRLGSLVIGVTIFTLPLRILSTFAQDAQLVNPGSRIAQSWKIGIMALTALVIVHMIGAAARGGRIRHFFIPFGNPFWLARRLKQGGAYESSRDAFWSFVGSLRLEYYLKLGFLGFVGTMAWIVGPVTLLAAGRSFPILGILGAILLGVVVMSLPFLQMRFATTQRFRGLFEWREIRQRFLRAPWAFAFTLFLSLTFAIPLYLLKIEILPREAAWLPSLFFVVFMFPTRVLSGWAYGRSIRRDPPRHWFFRWTGRLAMLPVAAFYVLIVFFSQFTAWRGIWSLYEQHAFLLPVPFLGL